MNESHPYFSVIIPVYNKKPHLERSIESVLKQSFKSYELIIINDSSTDGGKEVIDAFENKKIKTLHFDNDKPSGVSFARNKGINIAKADWVCFLDADDEWQENYLQTIYDRIQAHRAVNMVSCGYEIVTDDGKVKTNNYYNRFSDIGDHFYGIEEYISGPTPIWTSVVTIKRQLLIESGGFDESLRHGEDRELWLRLLLIHEAVGLWVSFVGGIYYKDSVNMLTNSLNQTFSASSRLIDDYLKNNPDHKLNKELSKYSRGRKIKPLLRGGINNTIALSELRHNSLLGFKIGKIIYIASYFPLNIRIKILKFVSEIYLSKNKI